MPTRGALAQGAFLGGPAGLRFPSAGVRQPIVGGGHFIASLESQSRTVSNLTRWRCLSIDCHVRHPLLVASGLHKTKDREAIAERLI